ncbi:putative outer membrane repeat protein [Acidovorax soli]|uniref:Putative outer membrane repeat protein n=1 Tax=Acidovorax soli TaxID=592050 RepID=A0A7X0PLF1_9BURK|nr:choice-of-anchor Q domain-containing protein [Acidovorax soli]MBB6564110.1 putative outer membrane repeat protein [Acidovorax soli]
MSRLPARHTTTLRLRHWLVPLLLLAAAAGSAQAAICRAAPTASGAADGSTWADAMTLPAALAASGCDEIWLRQGLYKPGGARTDSFGINRPLQLYGGFAGGETLRAQRNTNSRLTVLSGDIGGDDTADANGIVLDASSITGNNSYNVVRIGTYGGPGNGSYTPANTVIDGLSITAGHANDTTVRGGGGLYCNGSGAGRVCSPRIANVTFSGNRAWINGGAIYAHADDGGTSSPEISRSSFSGNRSDNQGGAIMLLAVDGGTVSASLRDSTFSGNGANSGGAVFVQVSGAGTSTTTVAHSAFIGNTATTFGGAITASSSTQLAVQSSVLWGNSAATSGASIHTDGTLDPLDGNLLENGCSGVNVTSGSCTGSPLTADPLLGALADNGGPTWSRLPGAGSPLLAAATCSAGATDQRGVARPTGAGACAIGPVEVLASLPADPGLFTASSGQVRQVTLSWDATAGAVDYVVTRDGGTAACTTSATSCVVTGLGNGASPNFSLVARNEAGTSATPQLTSGSTLALPAAASGLVATPGVRQITLTWAASGGADRYVVTDTTGGGSTEVCNTTSLGCIVGSLANGASYDLRLVARNAAGDSATPATTTAATFALPGAPATASAVAGEGQATISWTAPAALGGGSLTHYSVSGSPGGSCTPGLALTCTITGLAAGVAHTFTVTATTTVGTGVGRTASATPYAPAPAGPSETSVTGPGVVTITDPSLPIVVGPGGAGATLVLPGTGTTPVVLQIVVNGQPLAVTALPGTQLQVVQVNGQSVLVLVVLQGAASMASSSAGQPMALAGTVLLSSGVAGTRIDAQPLTVAVVSGSLVPPAGVLPELGGKGLLAGERLLVDAQGRLVTISLGSIAGDAQQVGDAMGFSNLPAAITVEAKAFARLGGPVARLAGANLAQGLETAPTGVVLVRDGAQVFQLLPVLPVTVDARLPDGLSFTPLGLLRWVRGGVVVQFAPAVADLAGLASAVAAVLPDARIKLGAEGVLQLATGGQTYVLRPDWTGAGTAAGAPRIGVDGQGRIVFQIGNGAGQLLLPSLLNATQANGIFTAAIPGATLAVQPGSSDGAFTLTLGGQVWRLVPLWVLPAGNDAGQTVPWRMGSDGVLYLKLGTQVQGVVLD